MKTKRWKPKGLIVEVEPIFDEFRLYVWCKFPTRKVAEAMRRKILKVMKS